MEAKNEWMNDPDLKEIDKAKLEFLDKMFVQSTSINRSNQKEMMSFLLSLSKLSRDNNISFNNEEVELIFSVLKKHSSSEDIAKMQKLSSFFRAHQK
ncbi:MAG: hypothetical protein J6C19_13360 [Lachnospiraceae bacterium]|nr:hypothetical protein [Lachnospiraceae bacterium]